MTGPATMPGRRTSARAVLGLAEDEFAVLLVHANAGSDAVSRFARWLSMAATANTTLTGLVSWRACPHDRARAARFLAGTGAPCSLLWFAGGPRDAAAAADLVVWPHGDGSGPGLLPVAARAAVSLGLPVATAHPADAALLAAAGHPALPCRGAGDHHWADLLCRAAAGCG